MDESQLLAEAIARAWPDDPTLLPPDATAIEPDLLDALRDLEVVPAERTEQVQARILALLRNAPVLNGRVHDELGALLLSTERAAGPAVDVLPQHHRHSRVEVLYATDRAAAGDMDDERRYGSDQGIGLTYGIAHVTIPDDYRMGRLPHPRKWRLCFRRSQERTFQLTASEDLTGTLSSLRARAPNPDVLVFVHGYNVSFADAARRTAQLAYDLNFQGVPLLYSWPSEARVLSYFVDGENASATQRHFRPFLRTAMSSTVGGRVHVVAHSMGNRVLTEALSTLNSYRLGHVVFAAPDMDARVFADRVAGFTGSAVRYTLYTSAKDRALAMSQRFVKYPRAGQAGSDILVVPGIDTVDATELDTDFLSHSYVLDHRSVVSDLYALIQHCHSPDERFGLMPVASPSGVFWMFRR